MTENFTCEARECVLVDGRSNKFWRCYRFDILSPGKQPWYEKWVAHWGRNGTIGQWKIMFSSEVLPLVRFQAKLDEGYHQTRLVRFDVSKLVFLEILDRPAILADMFSNAVSPRPSVNRLDVIKSLDSILKLSQ